MTIALTTAVVRHERRLRLVFSNSLGAGAFSTLAWYTITSDGTAADPSVVAAYAVANSPQVVELHLSLPLVQGALYTVSAVGVPAISGPATPNPSTTQFRVATERSDNDLGAHRKASDLERRLYGSDLVHDGNDFVEGPDGDLVKIAGLPVVKGDLRRGIESNGLPWAPTYGMHAREFVDAPAPMLDQIPGLAVAYVQKDDRVVSATAEVLTTGTAPTIRIRPVLIGDKLVSSAGEVQAAIK